jgi:hypothetical protein
MGRKTYKGLYKPRNPEKYVGDVSQVVYRSGWERKLMLRCDSDPNILKWGSETMPIQYYSSVDGKTRRYFVDFFIQLKDRSGNVKSIMVEVKPHKETIPPVPPKRNTAKTKQRYVNEMMTYQRNQDKWEAATAWGKKNGWDFTIMDEYSLGIKKRKA